MLRRPGAAVSEEGSAAAPGRRRADARQVLLALDGDHAEDDVAAFAARIRPRPDREATVEDPA